MIRIDKNNIKMCVIGLGYVGLPLAVEFAKFFDVTGFDISKRRIKELSEGHDATLELSQSELLDTPSLNFTSDIGQIGECNVYIVTVPTPIDRYNKPDLTPLISASETVSTILKKGDIVIYESTVYPGATEEVCVPILEEHSGLTLNQDFFVGYSPERINPGDKEHKLSSIVKVTSGSNSVAADFIDNLYASIITAGTHKTSSIKVAEAAKVIENTQRDVNIALVNELSMIFDTLGIDTFEVLRAAGTKWNFLPFCPGLVGGHCIGVDPYYLTHKAEEVGHHPEMILAGRRINDLMPRYFVQQFIKKIVKKKIKLEGARVLIMGFTFKENCPDIRNTKVFDIIQELGDYGINCDVHDPWASAQDVFSEFQLTLTDNLELNTYDAIIVAVGHSQYSDMGFKAVGSLGKEDYVFVDFKNVFNRNEVGDGLL
jgi:UDP-N-acetyl-D-galactosamine dehydrogenase